MPTRFASSALHQFGSLAGAFGVQSLRQPCAIDNHALMRSPADLLDFIPCADIEFEPATIDPRDLGLGRNHHPKRRGRHVRDVDASAQGAFAGFEIGFDCIEGSVFHRHDQDRRCQNRGQRRVLEAVGEVLRLDRKAENTDGVGGDVFHRIVAIFVSRCAEALVRNWLLGGAAASPQGRTL